MISKQTVQGGEENVAEGCLSDNMKKRKLKPREKKFKHFKNLTHNKGSSIIYQRKKLLLLLEDVLV